MAHSVPGTIFENVYGLPAGTIKRLGPEAAAQLALAIQHDPADPLVNDILTAISRANAGDPS